MSAYQSFDGQFIANNIFGFGQPVALIRSSEEIQNFTRMMGGDPLAGFPDVRSVQVALNLPCGPGDWALDVAYRYPYIEVAGIDASKQVVDYALARAHCQELKNLSFGAMDLHSPLDFSDNTFDIIYGRSFNDFLRRDQWHGMLQEMLRILRPNGTFRLVSADSVATNSLAFQIINKYTCMSLHQMGFGFSPDGYSMGIAAVIEFLMRKAGFAEIRFVPYVLNFSAGTSNWSSLYQSFDIIMNNFTVPLLQQGLSGTDIKELFQLAHLEIMDEEFCSIQYHCAVYGTKKS